MVRDLYIYPPGPIGVVVGVVGVIVVVVVVVGGGGLVDFISLISHYGPWTTDQCRDDNRGQHK